MKIIDISLKIDNKIHLWPGEHNKLNIIKTKYLDTDGVNVSRINMGLHTGTHIDSPLHHIKDAQSVNEINLNNFYSKAQVIDLTHVNNSIKLEDIINIDFTEKVILFKTKNSLLYKTRDTFFKEYIYLEECAANYLVKKDINIIGIDYLSIENFYNKEAIVHKILFSNNIFVLESLDLNNVEAGIYTFIGFPIKLVDTEASPVRAILIKGKI